MAKPTDTYSRPTHRRPVIGLLSGFQLFGMGMVYGYIDLIARGVQVAAHDRRCNLLLGCGMNLLDPPKQRPAWPQLMPDTDFVPVGPWNTDGLIVVHPLLSPERSAFIHQLRASGFPVVYIGAAAGGPAIDLDNVGGIRLAMEHLAQHGHRRVAFIRGWPDDDSGDSGERFRAYQAAVQEFGMEADLRLVDYGHHDITMSQRAIRKMIADGISFTAVLTSNDESAYAVIDVLEQTGRRVPQDVAVIGFDDFPDSPFKYKLPPLTSVHHPVFERGYQAVELLLDYIEGRRAVDATVVKVPTHLVRRRSCGCNLEDIVQSETALVVDESAPPEQHAEGQLAKEILRFVLAETEHLNPVEVHQLSSRLVVAFSASVKRGDPNAFVRSLQAVLARVEQTKGNVRPWSLMIDVIEKSDHAKALIEYLGRDPKTASLIREMLSQARAALDNSARRRRWQEIYFNTEENGQLTAALHAALNEEQILRVLARHLPNVGIRKAAVVLFEADENDPTAFSLMHTTDRPDQPPQRFRSCEFPPPLFLSPEPFRLALVPLLIRQRTPGYVAFDADNLELCANITHSINTALTAAHMYREALDGRRMAEEANRLKTRFLSTVSHELRTPLSVILATSEEISSESLANANVSSLQQNLARIRAGAQHLDGLIRDVLDLSQDEIGELKLFREPLNLINALEPVITVGEQLAHAKGLSWQTEFPHDSPKVWADRARLRQIVLNLITNAVKFTTHGGVTLRVESDPHSVTIAVQDTGLGIPPDEAEVIFDDFHQSTRTTTRGYGGLGLGLAICKRLVEMHAGKIGVRSSGDEGGGSTFFFSLPLLEIGSENIGRSLKREQTVLLLDDRSGGGDMLFHQLQQRGLVMHRVRVEEPTMLILSLNAVTPGVALIDAELAFGRGWDLLTLLKNNPAARDVPLLFYSFAPEHDTGSLLQLDCLTKPVGTEELLRALSRQGIDGDVSKTILIADDDPALLDVHVNIVRKHSDKYRVLSALNGRDAWTLIQQFLPDLVLLDLMMPKMDGFAVLEAMHTLETTRRIPVIVLTGQTLSHEDMARLNRGVAAVLAKGVFTIDETVRHIEKTLASDKPLHSEAQNLTRRAMNYIHEHYTNTITRTDIAGHLGVSEDHLTRYFQQAAGIPPMTYLIRYRIQRAKHLLDTTEMNMTDVAAATGFPNEFYFSRMFRRETGIAPSMYRRGKR